MLLKSAPENWVPEKAFLGIVSKGGLSSSLLDEESQFLDLSGDCGLQAQLFTSPVP
jgi:hypothetical protein